MFLQVHRKEGNMRRGKETHRQNWGPGFQRLEPRPSQPENMLLVRSQSGNSKPRHGLASGTKRPGAELVDGQSRVTEKPLLKAASILIKGGGGQPPTHTGDNKPR